MKSIENFLEKFIFQGRWLLAPFYVGLILAIGLLLVMFIKEFVHFAPAVFNGDTSDAVIGILGLIDVVMIANLVLIIVFAGYENFVSRIDTKDSEDRPDWMGTVSFSDLKIKLIGSIVAISGVELLKVFMSVSAYTTEELAWKVGLHLTFVFSGVLYALMDKLSHANSRHS